VIPNWNGRELLAEYFPSIVVAALRYRAETKCDFEIIVVDDASTDESLQWLEQNYGEVDKVKVIRLEENKGSLLAVNMGFRTAEYEIVVRFDNDVLVEPDCIGKLVSHFHDQNVFAVCSRAERIDSGRLDGGGKIGKFGRGFWRVYLNYEAIPEEANCDLISFYACSGSAAYDRKKLLELGGLQECLERIYWEDVEICYRAWKRGWKVLYEPRARVLHKGSATMNRSSVLKQRRIVNEQNRLLMIWINLHDRKMFISHLIWLTLKIIASLLTIRFEFLHSFGGAVTKFAKVRRARGIEKNAAAMTDRELVEKFEGIRDHPGIYVIHNESDEKAFAALRKYKKSQGLSSLEDA